MKLGTGRINLNHEMSHRKKCHKLNDICNQSRKSSRNKKKTSSESDAESKRTYTGNNTSTTNPYTLVRKGSDKIKAAKNFRTSKKQSSSEEPAKSVKPGKKDEWSLDASPLIGQL